ncbi:TonB-dependent receptor plug domain-containing protein [Sulfurimonas sp.]|uniref:TonB-dependent receptor plug domain-containing protein n=1 Tax=Sulfurimonas sp. TaxID=2022749 RepID=UPI003D0FF582
MKKTLFFLSCLSSLSFGVDLGVINVTGENETDNQQESFNDIFEEPEYIESSEYINSMPSQKRITTKEAMFIPGVQGDPVKAMQSLSGVTSLGDVSGEMFIYGSKPQESKTTINHLPIGYLFHMGGLHSVISPNAIDQIDAYMSGFDVTYGNAMGGVINVTPKYPDNNYNGYVHIGIYDSSAGINAPINDKISVFVGARRSYYDLLLNSIGKSTGTLDEDSNTTYTEFPNYYDFTIMAKYQADSNNLYSLELVGAGDSLEIDTQENAIKDPEATGNVRAKYSFATLGLRHLGYYNNYETNTLLYTKKDTQRTEFFDEYFVDYDNYEAGIFHQSTYTLSNHKLVIGGEYEHFYTPLDLNISEPPSPEDIDYDFTTAQKYYINETLNINTFAVFMEDIYNLSNQFTIRYGARYGYVSYNNFGDYFDPRISFLYTLNDTNNLSFSTGIYTQLPEAYKIFKEIGNPQAGYEQAKHYTLHYDNNAIDGLTFNIDTFYKDYDKLLIDDNASQYLNVGDGYAYGVDTSLKYRRDNLYLFSAYTYIKSKRQISTLTDNFYRFYGEIPHTLQLIGSIRFWDDWALSTRLNYHSGAPYTKVIGTYTESGSGRVRPIYGDPFSSRLPDYFSLNLKISQEIKYPDKSSLEWSFEIMNLTNHENISDIKYDDNYNEIGYYKQLPLLPWFDVTYKF